MKILSYILTPIFILVFFIILVICHPIQWIALKISYQAHKNVVDYMNWLLVKSLLILGTTVKVTIPKDLPKNSTIIFAANHQSLFDIPPIIWAFRKFHPKFVSKKELSKGIPSVSFNLKHGGAALIDRKDPKQALVALMDFSKKINANKWSTVIFPEGTRSRDGVPKSFSPNGLKMLTKYNPNGYVVPVTINNSWKVFKYGKFPLGLGVAIKIEAHQAIPINSMSFDELFKRTETTVKKYIITNKK
ncbi:1-acyl-sn-glycerol-3-phosphate acyltransferase [Putridiphycobacter roseus]|uniref:1-acyl-sn-glycerol-3-phosphate acyltransferase n=1 Tax=Putridiphycobacter roseus TaxID=2219161 RepID=A0A2W1NH01_9FLAO|nr:lysophospholipid acyltransferase family protein [Putridiphycobacter roseus]PZE18795.1 1-acyl-sn-glycerol-3-phosphate acyltransferase [Putridiphycobacter roseus]